MSPRVTRVLTATITFAIALTASAAMACDGNKSAKATACAPGAKATVTATSTARARGTAAAKKATTTRKAAPVAAKKAAPAEAGMWAYLDPETGRITNLPQVSSLAADGLPGGPAIVLVEEPLPGRGYTIDLQGTLQDYSVLHIDAQGRRHFGCSKDPRALLRQAPMPSTPALPEE